MKVNVAGAGAGKTTKMAELITGLEMSEGKIVFCIAFTNAAAKNITEKVEEKLGIIPDNIKISTIHSFLYQELVYPYYFALYKKHYERLSVIDLPPEPGYRRAKLSELENENILHYTMIPERAKWVAYQKSSDRKAEKEIRNKLLARFSGYCAAIFVDEAQDIGQDVRLILEALEQFGVDIILYGDPKQDVKGLGKFREIIENTPSVNYIPECHRCPNKHLRLSNTLASEAEQQQADEDNAIGSITIVFESDEKDIKQFIAAGNYGLKYISMKRDRFATHEKQKSGERFETLRHEVHRAMCDKWAGIKTELEIKRAAFYVTEQMLSAFDSGIKENTIIAQWVNRGIFDRLTGQRYAQMASAIKAIDTATSDIPVVSSIEIIKGREAKRCLFILSPDLAPYLFREKKEDNKTSHLLYVALTRSLDHLTILVMKEVEETYTKDRILCFFQSILQNEEV